jgi:hypothetical protein
MTTLLEVPLSAVPTVFPISLGGFRVYLQLTWRNAGGSGWVLDILDADRSGLVLGLPLVTGIDLLGQHRHLGIPGALYVATDVNVDAVPTYTNLGTGSHLYFISE